MAEGTLFVRTVLDTFAHSGLYLLYNAIGEIVMCRDVSDASGMPLGSRNIGMYPAGASVLVYQPPDQLPMIIGSAAPMVTDAKLALPDSLGIGTNVGAWNDSMHFAPLKDPSEGIANHSGGRPINCLPGDWGRINDLGAAVFLGRMLAMLRASDGAQIQAFWGDDLLRLTGYNMEVFTSSSEKRDLNDQGEHHAVYRSSPFPWEAMGKGGASGATHTESKVQPLGPDMVYGPIEPKEDDQLIVPRHVIVRGYLGDIEREYVCLPPAGLDISRFENEDVYLGLLEITKHIDGSYGIRSAKQITMEKYVLLPVPKELIAPEDPLGDNDTNYKFSGQYGDGEDHAMPEFEWDEDEAGMRAQQMWDYHAYFFGRYAQIGLARHKKDWYLPEEDELTEMANRAAVAPATVDMGHRFYAELPNPKEIKIDERSGHTVKFYATRSVIKQFDDGSILLEDGFGSQIRLEGGNIFLTCPGDVWTLPGRNSVTWAPHDVIQKGGNSVDITASLKDVRIKGEQNVHVLAANQKTGSILIECRGSGVPSLDSFKDKLGESAVGSGIFIKGPKTAVTIWGQRIYAGGSEKITGKQIVLDAGENGDVFLRGNRVDSQGKTSASLSTGDPGKSTSHIAVTPSAVTVESAQAVVGAPLALVNREGRIANLQVAGHAFFSRFILVEDGVATNGSISTLSQEHLAPRKTRVVIPKTANKVAIVVQSKAAIDASGNTKKQPFFEGDDALGDVPMSQAVGFSCRRTVEDHKLDQATFTLRSSRWQTLISAGGGKKTWEEPEVAYPDADGSRKTMPHPGLEAWKDWNKAFSSLSGGKNFNLDTGLSAGRSALDKEGQKPQDKKLEGNYTINVQK